LLASTVIFLDGPRTEGDAAEPRPKPGKPRDGAPHPAAASTQSSEEEVPF
jgi:hypothetical protein